MTVMSMHNCFLIGYVACVGR